MRNTLSVYRLRKYENLQTVYYQMRSPFVAFPNTKSRLDSKVQSGNHSASPLSDPGNVMTDDDGLLQSNLALDLGAYVERATLTVMLRAPVHTDGPAAHLQSVQVQNT